jgi:carbon-monoxide dehydrogenase medium subunit
MTTWKNYYLAQTSNDALRALAFAPGSARLIAGGTDLLLDLQQGRHPPVDTLVDITAVAEMNVLEIRQERLFVGAAVPLNQVIASALVREHAQALFEAGSLIGGPQVRNTATLGGNVAHALPAADGTISLMALEAEAEVLSLEGSRRVALTQMFEGPGCSTMSARQDLLIGFYLPLKQAGQGSAFRRVMRPQGVAIAILNMGVWVQRRQDTIENVRIAVGPAGPTPFRASAAENLLRGQPFSQELLAQAEEALLSEARFRTSPHRATATYRQRMAGVLLQETFSLAWRRAVENG